MRKEKNSMSLIREAKSGKRELHWMDWVLVSLACIMRRVYKATGDIYSCSLSRPWCHKPCYAKKLGRATGTDHDAAELDRDGRLEAGSDLCPCDVGAKLLNLGLEK